MTAPTPRPEYAITVVVPANIEHIEDLFNVVADAAFAWEECYFPARDQWDISVSGGPKTAPVPPSESDPTDAVDRVQLFLNGWDQMHDRGDIVYSVHVNKEDHSRDLLATDLRRMLKVLSNDFDG